MDELIPRAGKKLIIRAAYQARGFALSPGERLPEDPRAFDRAAHRPKLLQLSKGESVVGLTSERAGHVLARVERGGETYACALLPDSFDVGS